VTSPHQPANKFRSLQAVLKNSRAQLQQSDADNPQLEAEILLCHVLSTPRSTCYAWPDKQISVAQQHALAALRQRRCQGEPIAYLIGFKEFWSLDLKVSVDTLIPRPETELLVEAALNLMPKNQPITLIDLGTGSGAIAIAIASERPLAQIIAVDFSQAALNIAQQNAQQLNVEQIKFIHSDWFKALSPAQAQFDLIIANPPYIDAQHTNLATLQYEPQQALIAAKQGLADLELIIKQSLPFLAEKGVLILEHGYDQAMAVQALLKQQGYTAIQSHTDLAGVDRFCVAQY